MTQPNFMVLYVDSPKASGDFYSSLLGREPAQASPAFVLFALESGLMLGLWSREAVQPPPTASNGGTEVCVAVAGPPAVDAMHAEWKGRGVQILQSPTELGFGRSFVALDPDGHRLRVFAPAQQ
jgi:predicted enzyme related to lactoylglutathione lyase